ncbi:hypothetical protein EHM92_00805 [bacterium]|nr:MAG: hypothetical protein EHM92_00805 [bacterium]
MAKHSRQPIAVGIAWYRADQYFAVKAFCEDGNAMDPTYETWVTGAEEAVRQLQAQGTRVERVDFDLDDFKSWCFTNGQRPNAASRSAFTSLRLRDRQPR